MLPGDVAQLAERFVRNEEVVGSTPIVSTPETHGVGGGLRAAVSFCGALFQVEGGENRFRERPLLNGKQEADASAAICTVMGCARRLGELYRWA